MIAAIIKAVIEALASVFFGRKDAAQQRQDDRQSGAQEAAIETDQTTKDIADARSEIAARPDDADHVAERLRRKAAAAARERDSGQ